MSIELKEFKDKMGKSLDSLASEYTTIRAGRANPHVLDKIMVEYYGTPTNLQQVANISEVVDTYHLNVCIVARSTDYQTADTTETVDTYFDL